MLDANSNSIILYDFQIFIMVNADKSKLWYIRWRNNINRITTRNRLRLINNIVNIKVVTVGVVIVDVGEDIAVVIEDIVVVKTTVEKDLKVGHIIKVFYWGLNNDINKATDNTIIKVFGVLFDCNYGIIYVHSLKNFTSMIFRRLN